MLKKNYLLILIISVISFSNNVYSEEPALNELLDIIQKDLRTLERAVYSESFSSKTNQTNKNNLNNNEKEEILTRHLLKLSEIQKQFQELTNKYEEINFKLDKLMTRFSKTQSDNQLRFQQLENSVTEKTNDVIVGQSTNLGIVDNTKEKVLPGTNKPQDLGSISYKDMTQKNENQIIKSVDSTKTVLSEIIVNDEKILPKNTPVQQYEFATSFLKVGDYNMAERAFKEFVDTNPNHELSGNAQYWYAETFRIRQLYTDAASAYLEGYQKYPKSEKAPINLLKLGVSLVQIGEKDQGCLMIKGVKKQYPEAAQSVLQKAKYEEKKFECQKDNS